MILTESERLSELCKEDRSLLTYGVGLNLAGLGLIYTMYAYTKYKLNPLFERIKTWKTALMVYAR